VADGGEPVTRYFVRFTPWQRFQHLAVMTLFILLCVTGLPQKYFQSAWAAPLLGMVGGVDAARWLHRACGIAFSALLVAHVADLIVRLARGTASTAMVPHWKDVTDALTTLRYYVGLGNRQARFDRFDYKQKFEYWGMMLGSIIVVATGLVLLYPIEVTRWLPGSVVPVAVVAHSSEGLLAFLTIITWHIFNAALTPEVFPLDTSVFTGRISEERMRHEHPLELERLTRGERSATPVSDHDR
jgi:cytochrome b subunit of formate dehydrogenase